MAAVHVAHAAQQHKAFLLCMLQITRQLQARTDRIRQLLFPFHSHQHSFIPAGLLCRPNIFDTAEAVLNFAVQLAAGVNAFHVRGYVHGDLKPNNIGCCVLKSVVKVMDLGMVTQAGTLYVYGTGDLP